MTGPPPGGPEAEHAARRHFCVPHDGYCMAGPIGTRVTDFSPQHD